ncbi:MAG: class I SAM-dependent methyltransferase [Alphaproteobacteria bacterium]
MLDGRSRGGDPGAAPAAPDRYRGYREWKGWAPAAAIDAGAEADAFAGELAGIPLAGRDVLEIGFGRGAFLAWAAGRDARVCGLERDESLVADARGAGFEAHCVDLSGLPAGRQFDLIVAIDVLEHVPIETLLDWFARMPALLRPGGCLVARFPNGQSPLGQIFQHGDLTHVTTLSPGIARQLAVVGGLEVTRIANSHRPRGTGLRRLAQIARDVGRDGLEVLLARLYGFPRMPLDPNVTVVWTRLREVR